MPPKIAADKKRKRKCVIPPPPSSPSSSEWESEDEEEEEDDATLSSSEVTASSNSFLAVEDDDSANKKNKKSKTTTSMTTRNKKKQKENEELENAIQSAVKKLLGAGKKKGRDESAYSGDEDDEDSSDDDYSDDDDDTSDKKKKKNFILYSITGSKDDNSVGDYNGADEDAEILEKDENEECDSSDERTFIGEKYTKIENDGKADAEAADKKAKAKAEEEAAAAELSVTDEYIQLIELKKVLLEQSTKNPKNKNLQKTLLQCNKDIQSLVRDGRHSNTVEFHRLVHAGDSMRTNELEYFKKNLSHDQQQIIMRDLRIINESLYSHVPQRLRLLQSPMDNKYKVTALERLNKLEMMDPMDGEYHKIKHWVDNFMRIPFGVTRQINVTMDDGKEKCSEFMTTAKRTLDECVYGMENAKMQVMQMMGQWIVNPASVGSSIAIHGPPGTGKTSIVKEGVSKILGREFAFIALGGCGDSSYLEGHSYTYEGSIWGKIAQILMDCKSMNPVIYFDELDKVSNSARGQEIIGVLTHLTDSTQNSEFHDKYFCDVALDLSKCLFIFSYNDDSLINPILRDRMYCIKTKGYDAKEKLVIARKYLLPKIRDQVRFEEGDILLPDDTLSYIIGASHLTKGEDGVRNLKRCLEIIYTKLNLVRLIDPLSDIIANDKAFKDANIAFPFTVTRKDVDRFIDTKEPMNPTLLAMYV